MANTRAMSSFPYTDSDSLELAKALLKKAIGLLFYTRTAPIPVPEASYSIENGCVKSGKARTGAELTTTYNFLKASIPFTFTFHWKLFFFNISVRDQAILPYFLMNSW